MSSEAAITATGLAKTYRLFARPADRLWQMFRRRPLFTEVQALQPVTFTVPRGQTVGLIGRNGSGKSTLLQLLCGTLNPSAGTCDVRGRVSALLELGAGFNPEFTGHENIYLHGAILGLTHAEIDAAYPAIAAFAAIGDFLHRPVKTYSSGMYVRLAFAVAIAVSPDILVVDEALAVGDEAFQSKCYTHIRQLRDRGCTILFVSHSANTIVDLCDRVLLLDGGELLADGDPRAMVAAYHTLIYAPPAHQPAIREQLRRRRNASSDDKTDTGGDASTATTFLPAPSTPQTTLFDATLAQQESMADTQAELTRSVPCGAEIQDARLLDATGQRVNLLHRDAPYTLRYTVQFTEDARHVQFGMAIKTRQGYTLAGSGAFTEAATLPLVRVGETFDVRFTFPCRMLPEAYLFNAGVSAIVDGERRSLHRLMDICLCKVLPAPGQKATGVVDIGITADVDRVSEPAT